MSTSAVSLHFFSIIEDLSLKEEKSGAEPEHSVIVAENNFFSTIYSHKDVLRPPPEGRQAVCFCWAERASDLKVFLEPSYQERC